MAGIPRPTFSLAIILALTVLSAHLPAPNALKVGNQIVNQMVVTGNVCCSPDGGLIGGILTTPASGAKITVVFKGAVIATGVTAVDGSFKICINSAEVITIVANVADLKVCVHLPISTCPLLANVVGTLEGVPAVVGSVVGGVCNVAVGSFNVVVN